MTQGCISGMHCSVLVKGGFCCNLTITVYLTPWLWSLSTDLGLVCEITHQPRACLSSLSCKLVSTPSYLVSSKSSSIEWLFIQEYVNVGLKFKCYNFRISYPLSGGSKIHQQSQTQLLMGLKATYRPSWLVVFVNHCTKDSHSLTSSTVHPKYWKTFKQNPFRLTSPTQYNFRYRFLYDVFQNRKQWFNAKYISCSEQNVLKSEPPEEFNSL